jgi:exosortase
VAQSGLTAIGLAQFNSAGSQSRVGQDGHGAYSRMNRFAPHLLVVAGLGWAYWPTLQFLFGKWIDDPQYSHGFLVPLFSLYLLKNKREALLAPMTGWPILGGSLLALMIAVRGLAGGLLFHQLDCLALLISLAACVLMLGGGTMLRLTWPAIVFLIFAVPLPYELERNVGGPLRIAATQASTYLLQTFGFPAIAEGNVILIDEIKLGVVEACSGLKMLVTFAAFSVGAALLANRTGFEKIMVLLGIVPIALFSNVFRIVSTGIALTFISHTPTTDFLHDLFGWLMMPLGLALLGLELSILKKLVIAPRTGGQ